MKLKGINRQALIDGLRNSLAVQPRNLSQQSRAELEKLVEYNLKNLSKPARLGLIDSITREDNYQKARKR